jgi:putative two-component system response regulator
MAPQVNQENANCSILVVDDHAFNLEVMEGLLYGEGYKVLTASGGEEALKIAAGETVDLAILDVMMPGMNGFELCKRLKTMFGKGFFPVILVTALTELEDKIAGLQAGADDFLTKPFHTVEFLTKIRSLLKLRTLQYAVEHSEDVIMALATSCEAKDPRSKGHSERVGNLAMELASYLGMQQDDSELLFKAGVLHDIGKIGIREDIVYKTTDLTEEEMRLFREHTRIGEDICKPLFSARHVLPAIRSHHERWDGRGFPDGLKGEDIPFFARVVAIANSFDAMVSNGPHRPHFSAGEAVLRMEQERFSGQWDPGLLRSFSGMMKDRGCIQ